MSKTAIALLFAFGISGPATACELYPDQTYITMNGDRWGNGPNGFRTPSDCAGATPVPFSGVPQVEPQLPPAPMAPMYGSPFDPQR